MSVTQTLPSVIVLCPFMEGLQVKLNTCISESVCITATTVIKIKVPNTDRFLAVKAALLVHV